MHKTMQSAGFALLLAHCTNDATDRGTPSAPSANPPSQAVAAPQDDVAAAKEIFANRCTPCHGAGGAGDGAASASLTPRPANFTSAEWQAKVTDEHIEKIIAYGGSAVGKSPAMPPNPDLDSKPSVVKALRALIRGLKK